MLRQRFALTVQRVMLRTGRGRLRPVWWLAHEALARAAGLYLRGLDRRVAVYARASLGSGDPVYGLSDIDLTIALPDGERADRARVKKRRRRLHRALLLVPRLMLEVRIEQDLNLHAAPVLTHGLNGGASGSVYPPERGAPTRPRLQERPGLYGPLHDWRLLLGPERRPERGEWGRAERGVAAWLELQFWWRQAFLACEEPNRPRKRYLSVKLVAEPARILLWLVHGERFARRKEVLERALRLMPEEEASVRQALATLERLPDRVEPPLDDALRSLVRQSIRLVELLDRETTEAGVTPVRLAGAGGGRSLPLADWRARAVPAFDPDESFMPVPADPTQPRALARAASAGASGPYPALRAGPLLLLATCDWMRGRLRGAQCAITDPVSFALVESRDVAAFPNTSGWSAEDSAQRAVMEHRGWLEADLDGGEPTGQSLTRLLAAVRAAELWTSIEEGEPTLALTLADAARLLTDGHPRVRAVAEQACDEYETYRLESRSPSAATVAALRGEVLRLPAYRTA